jgi:hypothetical protein
MVEDQSPPLFRGPNYVFTKKPCGPNCVTYPTLKATRENLADKAFVCNVCMGEFVYANLAAVADKYVRQCGWEIPESKEEQINLFTYHMTTRSIGKYGMRVTRFSGHGENFALGAVRPVRYAPTAPGIWEEARRRHMQDQDSEAVGQSSTRHNTDVDDLIYNVAIRLQETRVGETTDDLIDGLMTGMKDMSLS